MTEFTAEERTFLRDLQRDPLWRSVLDKLGQGERTRRYRPSKGDVSQQDAEWKYHSGLDDGRDQVLKRLSDAT